MVYRNVDLSTIPSIPTDQIELARQQVTAYWSAPWYAALMGFAERIFAMCLHVSLSAMVLYSIAYHKPIWLWLAMLWHAVAVYIGQQISILTVEGIFSAFAVINLWIIFKMKSMFSQDAMELPPQEVATV